MQVIDEMIVDNEKRIRVWQRFRRFNRWLFLLNLGLALINGLNFWSSDYHEWITGVAFVATLFGAAMAIRGHLIDQRQLRSWATVKRSLIRMRDHPYDDSLLECEIDQIRAAIDHMK